MKDAALTTRMRTLLGKTLKIEATVEDVRYVLTFQLLQDLGQDHYLSCTHIVYEGNRDVGGGALSAEVCVKVGRPDLVKLLRWHMCDIDRGPMYYVANATYWAEYIAGCSRWPRRAYDPDPREAFEHTVVFGALETDTMPDLNAFPGEDPGDMDSMVWKVHTQAHVKCVVTEWCEARLPALIEGMRADLREFGLLD